MILKAVGVADIPAELEHICRWICTLCRKSPGGQFPVEFINRIHDLPNLYRFNGIMLYCLACFENTSCKVKEGAKLNFNIVLFEGTDSIKFGMTHEEVRSILGICVPVKFLLYLTIPFIKKHCFGNLDNHPLEAFNNSFT
jgi:hypothetical protein